MSAAWLAAGCIEDDRAARSEIAPLRALPIAVAASIVLVVCR